MTYEEALEFWLGRVNFEVKTPGQGDFKLDRMRTALDRLGRPQDKLRILHVAGTKGKGSTAAMLASILRHAGYRVGLFTSPHLVDVSERIQVDREPIARVELTDRLAEIQRVCDHAELTFFEIATLVGLLHFRRRRAEWAVLEVGLGGRLDSTNVCRPVASIITSISLDHTQMLGNTLSLIAREKAGIIKPGRPVISGVLEPEARVVIEQIARERHAPLRQLQRDFHFAHTPALLERAHEKQGRVKVTTWKRPGRTVDLTLIGEHQAANAAVTLATIETLRDLGVPIPPRAIEAGLGSVAWPARLELLRRRPYVVLDCAHNVASAVALMQALQTSFPQVKRRVLIFAGSKDKDLAGMLKVFEPHFGRVILTRFTNSPRSLPPEQILELAGPALQAKAILTSTSAEALREARAWAHADDLILATGSVFLAGELRETLLTEPKA